MIFEFHECKLDLYINAKFVIFANVNKYVLCMEKYSVINFVIELYNDETI